MNMEEKKKYIHELLKDDPLYKAIVSKGYDKTFYSDDYLEEINVKKPYGTLQVAQWFGVSDSQLRYYIKPFSSYLVDEETPINDHAYRLTFTAILKLRMMFLLKDDYKKKGLELLIKEEASIVNMPRQVQQDDDTLQKIEELSTIIEQITNSGLFSLQKDSQTDQLNLAVNPKYFEKFSKELSAEEVERDNLQDLKKEIKMVLSTEYLRLDFIDARIKDLNKYQEIVQLKTKKSNSFFSFFKSNSSNDEEVDEFIKTSQQELEFYAESRKVVKETIKTKEMELTSIDKKLETLQKTIETQKTPQMDVLGVSSIDNELD